MSISFRRYEILLPRRFNDGGQIPPHLVADTLIELRRQFGAASCETQTIQAQWRHQREVYHDEFVRVFVDVEDVLENRRFFLGFKDRLKQRFQQVDIWMTSYSIDVL
jgi:hypothetical protein